MSKCKLFSSYIMYEHSDMSNRYRFSRSTRQSFAFESQVLQLELEDKATRNSLYGVLILIRLLCPQQPRATAKLALASHNVASSKLSLCRTHKLTRVSEVLPFTLRGLRACPAPLSTRIIKLQRQRRNQWWTWNRPCSLVQCRR